MKVQPFTNKCGWGLRDLEFGVKTWSENSPREAFILGRSVHCLILTVYMTFHTAVVFLKLGSVDLKAQAAPQGLYFIKGQT